MCGVIGIYGNSDVRNDLWLGLIGLQHRGQDAAGIITYDRGRFYLKKGKGTVQSLFTSSDLNRLKGNIGVGHVRYPTIGVGDPEDAQPFYTNSPFGIAMAHNGNVINYAELRNLLVKKEHRHINTKNDVEVILNLLASQIGEIGAFLGRYKRESFLLLVFEAVGKVMDKVKGSYACVCFIAGQGLLAFRDPHGIKPLKFGQMNGNFCFASESVALDTLGYTEMRDVSPGEAIFVDIKKQVHSKIIKPSSPRHCIFEYIYFARPDSVMDGVNVYEARFKLGHELAKEIVSRGINCDVVIPIPDTARTVALGISESLGVPSREGLIKNRYIGRTFIMPRDEKRIEWVRYKLNPVRCEIENRRVLLVDDSIVRGATSKAIISLVREANPAKVYFASSCPPLRYPCYYGIDMQTRQEFISSKKSIPEIQAEIGADELVYQTMEGMLRAMGNTASYCTACFNGDYPTPIEAKEVKRIEKERSGIR